MTYSTKLEEYLSIRESHLSRGIHLTTEIIEHIYWCYRQPCKYCDKPSKLLSSGIINITYDLLCDDDYVISNIVPACSKCLAQRGSRQYHEWFPVNYRGRVEVPPVPSDYGLCKIHNQPDRDEEGRCVVCLKIQDAMYKDRARILRRLIREFHETGDDTRFKREVFQTYGQHRWALYEKLGIRADRSFQNLKTDEQRISVLMKKYNVNHAIAKHMFECRSKPCKFCNAAPHGFIHEIPPSRGGQSTVENIVPCCAKCIGRVTLATSA